MEFKKTKLFGLIEEQIAFGFCGRINIMEKNNKWTGMLLMSEEVIKYAK